MQWIELLKAALYGLIEGITEWLPISSTGHMILFNQWIPLDVSQEFWDMFLVVIQLGAIMAVVVLFWNRIFPFSFKPGTPIIRKDIFSMWWKILVAVVPAIIIGIPFDDTLERLFYNPPTVALMLIAYGVVFIIVENRNKNKAFAITDISQITYKFALFIGLFQLLALIPGTSRSGATIIGAMMIGASRTVAAEFTFFLAIPVMFGASLLKLVRFGFDFVPMEIAILVTGMVVAFIVSLAAIKFLMEFVKKHDFKPFGWYRIALGAIILLTMII